MHLIAIGGLKTGPERELVDDYLGRLNRVGRTIGLRSAREVECASGGGRETEAHRLVERCPAGAQIVLLDEAGKAMASAEFACWIGQLRDDGCRDLCFLIGGADGHGPAARSAAQQSLALGRPTWPHRLVRVMLAEQLYRAASILAGQPYHKA